MRTRCIAACCAVLACLLTQLSQAQSVGTLTDPREIHLRNVRQLTFGGQNAEAYFSHDGNKIIFQSTRPPYGCDQIFIMNSDGSDVTRVSSGEGRTTCAFFLPDGKRFIYASTHLADSACPPEPDRSRGYVWPLYPSFDIFSAGTDGTDRVRLTAVEGYDAEGAVSPDGQRIVFTSVRDGDLELYTMDVDGSDVKRLTRREGFDGGPFFSWDGRYIVYRSHYPDTAEERDDYRSLLSQDLMRPSRAEIFYMKEDGSDQTRVTSDGSANWAPFMHPDSRRIIYSSNKHDPEGRTFSLYMINRDGSGDRRITFGARFDAFPMFSRDGRRLVWCSTRNARGPREFNVFVADWMDQ
ncbi:MAG: PD40 domain-containing protein [bacterium]|nr:MAG: PD40 domain-containing protein [bacterium]